MNLRKLILTENACYKAGKTIVSKGIMVHSSGANNPYLKRYVGPDDGLLGKNPYNNHWNQDKPDGRQVCVHGFIGKLADGSIATYQTLPWNHRGWHAGGSANDTHIGFEICEDDLTDASYFSAVYKEAVELCVYLCKQYNLTEKDIICHSEGYKRGIASNHGDVMHWFPRHGKSMDTFRADVKKALIISTSPPLPSPPLSHGTEEYVQYMTEHNQDQMSRSVSFLESQKEKTDKELQEAIKALQEYEKKPRGVAVLELEFNSKSQDLLSFNSRLKSSQVEIQRLNSGVAELEAGLVVTPYTISVQKWDQISGTMVLSEESNPVYVAMASQLSEKRAELAEKLGEVEGLSRLVDSMNSDLNALQAELTEKRVEQEKLQREVERLRQTSETLAQKATETQIAKSIDLGDTIVSVVSAAAVPKNPVKPNKKLNMAIALVLGLMVFSLLAFLLEYLDNTIKTPDDVMRELELPVLGVIPKLNKKSRQNSYYGG
jgi:N-acetylmuramoyl-L-alanine amidase